MEEQTEYSEHRHIKVRCRGITQKKEYNIHNMVKVWNQNQKDDNTHVNVIHLHL